MKNIFKDKTVIVTGHTGFKGSWLISWLRLLGAKVVGISLNPPTSNSHYDLIDIKDSILDLRIDIRDYQLVEKAIVNSKPDFIFHLAAQSLVRSSYISPLETWQVNLLGTLNILEALRIYNKPCVGVIITSDKCYKNVEWIWGYRESDVLGGPDPYSASKGAAELAINSHIKSFFPKGKSKIRLASARAGNVIGGGDWAENRIIPDCVRAWSKNKVVSLRNPNSTRPWQHVLEPLGGYLTLAAELLQRPELHGESFNFGPRSHQTQSVLELVQQMALYWKKVRWKSHSQDNSAPYESGLLKLNCDKALEILKWQSALSFEQTVNLTAKWYKSYYENPNKVKSLTERQIKKYINYSSK